LQAAQVKNKFKRKRQINLKKQIFLPILRNDLIFFLNFEETSNGQVALSRAGID